MNGTQRASRRVPSTEAECGSQETHFRGSTSGAWPCSFHHRPPANCFSYIANKRRLSGILRLVTPYARASIEERAWQAGAIFHHPPFPSNPMAWLQPPVSVFPCPETDSIRFRLLHASMRRASPSAAPRRCSNMLTTLPAHDDSATSLFLHGRVSGLAIKATSCKGVERNGLYGVAILNTAWLPSALGNASRKLLCCLAMGLCPLC